jgi:hypothetical protein
MKNGSKRVLSKFHHADYATTSNRELRSVEFSELVENPFPVSFTEVRRPGCPASSIQPYRTYFLDAPTNDILVFSFVLCSLFFVCQILIA